MIKNEKIERLLINILKGIGFGFFSGDGGVSVGKPETVTRFFLTGERK